MSGNALLQETEKPVEQPKQEILYQPHPGPQTEFHRRREDVVLYGGAKGPGKSFALLMESLRQIANPKYHAAIIRRTFPKLQEMIDRAHTIFPRFKAVWNADLKRYLFPSGAFVEFGHCENEIDKERYQGREITWLGIDQIEEFTESQFNFLCAQNRTSDPNLKCQVRLTANPGSIGHQWLKRRFIDRKEPGKTYTQAFKLPDGREVTKTYCFIRGTVYDNPTLLKANPTYLATLMALPEIERRAYLEGDWNAFASQCVFDSRGMQLQETLIQPPQWVGFLQPWQESYQVIPDTNGNLKVWELPRTGNEYEIGADIAEGDAEGDYSSAHVVNKKTWEVVAHWYGQIDPLKFGDILFSLGQFYNLCEIAPEINGPGVATVSRLKERGYPSVYQHEPSKYGWRTDLRTRHNMLATFFEAIKDASVKVRDRITLDEMYNLIRTPTTQKIEARESCHDDCVISLAIALQCIRVNPFYESPVQRSPVSKLGAERIAGFQNENRDRIRRSSTGYR